MSLFQQSVLKKYLLELDASAMRQRWNDFQIHFHNPEIQENIRNLKEEEYQGLFINDLFVKILGYTLKPQPGFDLVLEKKSVTDATKSDGAILLNDEVIAVIELKDTGTTDLAKVSNQAFGYKHKHKKCIYVITSNFEKLRFYINDSVEVIEFNLFKLTEEEFSIFWICLAKQNIDAGLPLKINQQSLVEEGLITEKLYSDYSDFKTELYADIVKRNKRLDKIELFKKTQKLLDRFLFIFFSEDRSLLPPNLIIKILDDWHRLKDLRIDQPLYERFKLYFKDLHEGNSKEDIFAYNGGLFEPDELLNNILINDEILEKGVRVLSSYDYNTEIDVNILGHIFEHSLNELEQIQAELIGTPVERNKTRRKKEGVFYTPRFITKFMVESTLGLLCLKKKAQLGIEEEDYINQKFKTSAAEEKRKKKLLKNLDLYSSWLLKLAICDPACGSGAFLNAALEFLINEHRALDDLTRMLMGYAIPLTWTPNDILEHNLFGVDINEEAVEIARLSLWLRTASKERKLSNLSGNIKRGNSIIEGSSTMFDKGFVWKDEFPDAFSEGGFDVIIGNPPYVDIKALPGDMVKYLFSHFVGAENRVNLFAIFIEKALSILKPSGEFSFIIPSSLLTQDSYGKLRQILLKNTFIRSIVRLPNESFGGGAGEVKVDTIILSFTEDRNMADLTEVIIYKGFDRITEIDPLTSDNHLFISQSKWDDGKEFVFRINVDSDITGIVEKIELNSVPLSSCAEFSLGLTPYDKYRGHTEEQILNRVFHAGTKKDSSFKKLLAGNDITRYHVEWNGEEWISYGKWLGAAREQKFFTEKRILVKQIIDWSAKRIWAALTEEELYNSQNAFNLIAKDEFLPEYLIATLNSKLMSFYHKKRSLEEYKDRFQKILIKDCKQFPIKKISPEEQKPFLVNVNRMIALTNEFYSIKQSFLELLRLKFDGLEMNRKLSNWIDLSEKDFLKELKRQDQEIVLSEELNWINFLKQEKVKAVDVSEKIGTADRALDELVCQLYGIQDDEKKIIEDNI